MELGAKADSGEITDEDYDKHYARLYLKALASARGLHRAGWVNLDLKLNQFVVDIEMDEVTGDVKETVLMIDFGTAQQIDAPLREK